MGKKIDMPDKEELRSKYILENLRKDELASHYRVSVSTISHWLSHYGIKKDAALLKQSISKSIEEKYGSREKLNAKAL